MAKFEKRLKMLLHEQGIYIGRKASLTQLEQFFRLVWPVSTNHPLIRIGGEGDGGYLLPDDLDGIEFCFSPGVSLESHFELALAEHSIRSFLADYSVEKPVLNSPMFDFEKKFIGVVSNDKYMTMESWVGRKVGPDCADMMLQMDIEGAEYEVFCDVSSDFLKRFRIIIVEFHKMQAVLDKYGLQLINIVFQKILKQFDVVHIHPNNNSEVIKYKQYVIPENMEFTFLNKERVLHREYATAFPHPMDIKNMHSMPDIVLPSCWYKS